MLRAHRHRCTGAAFLAALALLAGCNGPAELPSSPVRPDIAGGKPAASPSVAEASPAYGYRGDIGKLVTITGTGFAVGAKASWERNGVPDPEVQVVATQFVSSTQLVATITITSGAALDFYDIAVVNPDKKRGIGYARFEVTNAILVEGASLIRGANEAGQFVGSGDFSFFRLADGTLELLAGGGPWGLSDDGLTVAGGTGLSAASGDTRIWNRVGGVWQGSTLPQDPAAVSHNARGGVASDPTTGAAVAIGGVEAYPAQKGNQVSRKPRLWLASGSGWSRVALPSPSAASDNIVDDVTAGLVAAGTAGGQAAIWEPNGTGWTLILLGPGSILGLNRAGTIAAGMSNGVAAYWRKVGPAWIGPTLLPSACTKGVGVDDFERIFCANAVVLPPYSSADVRQLRGFGETVGRANVEAISPRGSWAVGSANEHLHGGYVGAYWNIF